MIIVRFLVTWAIVFLCLLATAWTLAANGGPRWSNCQSGYHLSEAEGTCVPNVIRSVR